MLDKVVTAVGTPNIALVKYWGKRDDELTLPINGSVSMTLGRSRKGEFATVTSVVFSKKFRKDTIYVDGIKRDITDKRVNVVVNKLRALAKTSARVLIVSKNMFPADAGVASSASGLSTLTFAAAKALDLNLSDKELSMIARLGSGSASRSMYGGFVVWHRGKRKDGMDSYAEQIMPFSHWPDMVDIIALTDTGKKEVSTSEAMGRSAKTSRLYAHRAKSAERNVSDITKAIRDKDFETLGRIAMQDSNNMHAVMLDTMPPVTYLNDVSKRIMKSIHALNEREGHVVAAYTFDAGPNAHIITTKKKEETVMRELSKIKGIVSVNSLGIAKNGPVLESSSLIDGRTLEKKR